MLVWTPWDTWSNVLENGKHVKQRFLAWKKLSKLMKLFTLGPCQPHSRFDLLFSQHSICICFTPTFLFYFSPSQRWRCILSICLLAVSPLALPESKFWFYIVCFSSVLYFMLEIVLGNSSCSVNPPRGFQ